MLCDECKQKHIISRCNLLALTHTYKRSQYTSNLRWISRMNSSAASAHLVEFVKTILQSRARQHCRKWISHFYTRIASTIHAANVTRNTVTRVHRQRDIYSVRFGACLFRIRSFGWCTVTVCVCALVSRTVPNSLAFLLFSVSVCPSHAPRRHFLHVCVVPMLVLHPRRTYPRVWLHMTHAEGWKSSPSNRMENTINRDEHTLTASTSHCDTQTNDKECASKRQRSSVFIGLLPSTLHSVRWDSSLRLELGHFSLSFFWIDPEPRPFITRETNSDWNLIEFWIGFAWRTTISLAVSVGKYWKHDKNGHCSLSLCRSVAVKIDISTERNIENGIHSILISLVFLSRSLVSFDFVCASKQTWTDFVFASATSFTNIFVLFSLNRATSTGFSLDFSLGALVVVTSWHRLGLDSTQPFYVCECRQSD